MLAQFDDAGTTTDVALDGGALGFSLLLVLAILFITVAGMWKTFEKAGQPGWAAIIPIYNLYVLLQIVGKPWWWLILYLIPIVNIVVGILIAVALAEAFGMGIGFAIGLILLGPIFLLILGFGSAEYRKAVA